MFMKQTYETRIYNIKYRRRMNQKDLPTDHKNS